MSSDTLGSFEYEVLAVLVQQPHDAYNTTIRERIRDRTEREPSGGALHTALNRLEAKEYVESWWGEATARRGGRRKRFFQIKAAGVDAVRRTESRMRKWADLGGSATVTG